MSQDAKMDEKLDNNEEDETIDLEALHCECRDHLSGKVHQSLNCR